MRFENIYQQEPNFPYRYIAPSSLEKFLCENLSDYVKQIGTSTLGVPIYMLRVGRGNKKVLAWSQMHGNESNATHALLDMLYSLKDSPLYDNLFAEITLDFIVMLNPDGSALWTRRNALEIDLNRDFIKRSSKELPLLVELALSGTYDFGLNLHEQRTIFSTDGMHPATLSFLAPSQDSSRSITPVRKRAMKIISDTAHHLRELIPENIARYSDEYYPTSTGDNFMRLGLPTILFEGGHYEKDYQRQQTRKYYTIALYYCLVAIGKYQGDTLGYEQYFALPENRESHYDIIYRNVKLNTDFPCVLDIAVQYREEKKPDSLDIEFIPIVVEVGDCGKKKGWEELDCTDKRFVSQSLYPKLDAPVNFQIL